MKKLLKFWNCRSGPVILASLARRVWKLLDAWNEFLSEKFDWTNLNVWLGEISSQNFCGKRFSFHYLNTLDVVHSPPPEKRSFIHNACERAIAVSIWHDTGIADFKDEFLSATRDVVALPYTSRCCGDTSHFAHDFLHKLKWTSSLT